MVDDIEKAVSARVKSEFWNDFTQFVRTGHANDKFFAYMEMDKSCQEAVDICLEAQAKAFRKIGEMLKGCPPEGEGVGITRPRLVISDGRAVTIQRVLWASTLVAAFTFSVVELFRGLTGQARIEQMQASLDYSAESLQSARVIADAATKEAATACHELATKSNELQIAQKENDRAKEETKALKAANERLSSEKMKSETQLADEIKSNKSFRETVKDLTDKLTAKDAALVSMVASNEKFKVEIASIKEENAAIKQQESMLKAEIEKLSKLLANAKESGPTEVLVSLLGNQPVPMRSRLASQLTFKLSSLSKNEYIRALLLEWSAASSDKVRKAFESVAEGSRWHPIAVAEAFAIDGKTEKLFEILTQYEELLLKDPDENLQVLASRVVAQQAMIKRFRTRSSASKLDLTRLVDALSENHSLPEKLAAAQLLSQIGQDANSALPTLKQAYKATTNEYPREVFRYAIRQIGGSEALRDQ